MFPRTAAVFSLPALIIIFLAGCTASSTSGTVTEEQRDARLTLEQSQRLDALTSQYPEATVPAVELVRMVTLSEWPETMAACLTELGFPATVEDGGVASTTVAGQEEAKEVARYVCNVMYPLDPKFNEPLNAEQLDFLFDYFTGELTKCLSDQGVEVSSPPSRQLFAESFVTAEAWSPYLSVPEDLSSDEWTALNVACPQGPEGLYDIVDE